MEQPVINRPFQIEADDITRLDEDAFALVMNHLIRAEASLLRIDPANVRTSIRFNDPDGGIAAVVHAGESPSRWLPTRQSIWQFKGGRSPLTDARLRREIAKPGVREALDAGATYCLAMSISLVSQKAEELASRLNREVQRVRTGAASRLLFADDIGEWATEHPQMLSDFGRQFPGLWRLDHWLQRQTVHAIPWSPDPARNEIIAELTQALRSDDGPTHVRIQGERGIGRRVSHWKCFAITAT